MTNTKIMPAKHFTIPISPLALSAHKIISYVILLGFSGFLTEKPVLLINFLRPT